MGQRTVTDPGTVHNSEQKTSASPYSSLKWSLFTTEVGWCGLLGRDHTVSRLCLGHHSRRDAHEALQRFSADEAHTVTDEIEEADWYPALRERLQDYFQGARVDFEDIALELPPMTAFQSRVIRALQKVGYGEQITYGELARKAGAPRAARAVGTVMSGNRIPVLIPCHRVVASGGKLGGFSAPQGTSLKAHLLQLESRGFDETGA
ncbi:methylated-DNA--[protein]-cysteine S-methyltransferase [Gimesia panareensis]|uniref:methylated-DNA--[protein]-cysteine S-methyltransferase n=1 Tax=Gimesia panareensis TaxID=2527978 RepID=UPI001189A94F|nr:methylated-DNA--[protein]-cysteine S-methyltransferase [Gimesia panareensis]QDU52766.1 Methylated-DNA--protein-cysteine methyltransferase, constitutive [Gimesia panareensis]